MRFRPQRQNLLFLAASVIVVLSVSEVCRVAVAATAIVDPPADRVVDFHADLLPILQKNCLACHSASKPEGEVVLETSEAMRAKRDEGALVIPGDAAKSRLLQIAARQDEPIMPPEDNKVGAVALKPVELGLLKRWIEQGAKDAAPAKRVDIKWQPVPESHRSILATAIAPAGDFAVCSRGGELMVYGLQPGATRGELSTRLVDPSLKAVQVGNRGAAHLDMVWAVAVHGDIIASAGFRTVKLWQRYQPVRDLVAVPSGAIAATTSADGKRLAIALAEGSIQILDTAGEKPAVSWKAFGRPAAALGFSSNSEALIAAGEDGQVRAWQAASGAPLAGWRLSVPAKRLIVPTDDMLITAGDDLQIRVWKIAIPSQPTKEGVPAELPRIEPVRSLVGHGRPIASLAALPGGSHQFLSGSIDGSIRQWNADDGCQSNLWIHGDTVTHVAASADGKTFISLGDDRNAKVWSVAASEPAATISGDYRQARQVEHAKRLAEIARANVGDAKTTVETSEKQLAAEKQSLEKIQGTLAEAKKAADAKSAALNDAMVKHDAEATKLKQLNEQRTQAEKTVAESKTRVDSSAKELDEVAAAIKLVPESGRAAAAAAEAALAKIRGDRAAYLQGLAQAAQAALEAATKQRDGSQAVLTTLAKQREEAQKAADAAVAAQKDAQATVTRNEESIARGNTALDAARQGLARMNERLAAREKDFAMATQAAQNDRPAFALASFSHDGKMFLLIDKQQRSFVYDMQSFAPLTAWDVGEERLLASCFVGNKEVVICSAKSQAEGRARRWGIMPEWKLTRTIGSENDPSIFADRVTSLDFSPDGRLLATGSGEPSRSGQIAIWKAGDGSLVKSIHQPHSDVVFDLAFSPDGEYLASASADRMMKVVKASTGELVRTFEGHSDHVVGVTWRANGQQLATAGADHKVKIWDFELGEQRRSIDVGAKEVTAVTYLGTEGQVVSSSGDRAVHILNAENGATTRTLTGAAGYLFCCDVSEAGGLVVAGGDDRVLRVWNGADGKELLKLESPK